MIGASLVALATAWTVVVIDAIAESAGTDGRSIAVVGTTVGRPGSPAGIWILIGGVAVALLLWGMALAVLRGRRLQRRVDAQLEDSWRVPARPRAIPPMPEAPPMRLSRLGPEIALLERRREDLLRELRQVQHQLETTRGRLDEAAWYDRIEEALIILPEFEGKDELASRRTSRREPLEG
jgi:hypothetical protein